MERKTIRKEMTAKVFRRIAELQIQARGLNDTPEEYIEKCIEKTKTEIETDGRR